jgi:carbon-monoxide dehydrogenase medium subunit
MGVATLVTVNTNGTIERARLVFTGSTPHRSKIAEEQLVGQKSDPKLFRKVANRAAAELETESDIHASAEYRKEVAGVLARRVLEQAATRASSV